MQLHFVNSKGFFATINYIIIKYFIFKWFFLSRTRGQKTNPRQPFAEIYAVYLIPIPSCPG